MADAFTLTYLTFDSLIDGVGASQVVPYVVGLAERGQRIELRRFERSSQSVVGTEGKLRELGICWTRRRFGSSGELGGLERVYRGITYVRGAELVHARSDLAAASSLLAGCSNWVWDMRSFWADERIELGTLRVGSAAERAMRMVERRSARSAGAIVTLAEAPIPVLAARHGPNVALQGRGKYCLRGSRAVSTVTAPSSTGPKDIDEWNPERAI
jgi:hypothetical protein